jgi:hypothetical protein
LIGDLMAGRDDVTVTSVMGAFARGKLGKIVVIKIVVTKIVVTR